MMQRRLKVFFDGGARPNPGPIEAAVVVRGRVQIFDDLGHGNNRDAEWRALIRALEVVKALGLRDVELIGDAAEVIAQADRALRSGAAEDAYGAALLALVDSMGADGVGRIRWIKRAQNLAGIALAALNPR